MFVMGHKFMLTINCFYKNTLTANVTLIPKPTDSMNNFHLCISCIHYTVRVSGN